MDESTEDGRKTQWRMVGGGALSKATGMTQAPPAALIRGLVTPALEVAGDLAFHTWDDRPVNRPV